MKLFKIEIEERLIYREEIEANSYEDAIDVAIKRIGEGQAQSIPFVEEPQVICAEECDTAYEFTKHF